MWRGADIPSFGTLITSLTSSTSATIAAAGVAIFVWLLVRKRQRRIWLPTVRILDVESRRLPKLRITIPPLIAFLCFLLSAAAIGWFSFQPRDAVLAPEEPTKNRTHIFVDRSPSVTAGADPTIVRETIAEIWRDLSSTGQLSLSTTHDLEIHQLASEEQLNALWQKQGFHRSGVRIGQALKKRLDVVGEIDRLVIVSDRDQHSWTGFNWEYLTDYLELRYVDLSEKANQTIANTFINGTSFLSSPDAKTMDWEVELRRTRSEGRTDGELEVSYQGAPLATVPWEMAPGRDKVVLTVNWPQAAIKKSPNPVRHPSLLWKIRPNGEDAIELDNQFRSPLKGQKRGVLLIAEPAGEQPLDDPAHDLTVALEVFGFSVKRIDSVAQPGPLPQDYPFWIVLGGTGRGLDAYCPKSIEKARLAKRSSAGAKAPTSVMPKIWLAPSLINADFRELCWCATRLMFGEREAKRQPKYCEDVATRDLWTGLLPSLGAKQIGGDVGDQTGSLAWLSIDRNTGLELLSFTLPLRPRRQTGLSHAQIPVLIDQLLAWHQLKPAQNKEKGDGWPRIADRSSVSSDRPEQLAQLATTNVPLGESLSRQISLQALPPRWTLTKGWQPTQGQTTKEREDPIPWMILCLVMVIVAMGVEAILNVVRFIMRFVRSGAAIVLLSAGLWSDWCEAKIQLSMVDYPRQTSPMRFLGSELSRRTSIELDPQPREFSNLLDQEALAQPWLWLSSPGQLASKGALKPELVKWLKRGGFLIIENATDDQALARYTAEAFAHEPTQLAWRAIPPDHELMRSFYLIDALPVCLQKSWKGLQFDGRLAAIAIPFAFLDAIQGGKAPSKCTQSISRERAVRVFVNIVMVALATDYKRDQIHLPEILKRLR